MNRVEEIAKIGDTVKVKWEDEWIDAIYRGGDGYSQYFSVRGRGILGIRTCPDSLIMSLSNYEKKLEKVKEEERVWNEDVMYGDPFLIFTEGGSVTATFISKLNSGWCRFAIEKNGKGSILNSSNYYRIKGHELAEARKNRKVNIEGQKKLMAEKKDQADAESRRKWQTPLFWIVAIGLTIAFPDLIVVWVLVIMIVYAFSGRRIY